MSHINKFCLRVDLGVTDEPITDIQDNVWTLLLHMIICGNLFQGQIFFFVVCAHISAFYQSLVSVLVLDQSKMGCWSKSLCAEK